MDLRNEKSDVLVSSVSHLHVHLSARCSVSRGKGVDLNFGFTERTACSMRLLVLALVLVPGTVGFVIESFKPRFFASTALCAGKAGKSSKLRAPAASGGGFGAPKTAEVQNEYALFPALEPNVLDTLVPSPNPSTVGGDLPNEPLHYSCVSDQKRDPLCYSFPPLVGSRMHLLIFAPYTATK
jgi:hypothetical protein